MSRPGMGALLFDGGCAFRVWAPHAHAVSVVGDFNQWRGDAHPLMAEGNGNWYGEVPGAAVGHQYKFQLQTDQGSFMRVDPRARAVTNSVGNGIIHDPYAFDWHGDSFRAPDHGDLVIYELHVGSFDGHSFADVIDRLGHFEHLGVNCLQLMPVMEFAGDQSWGYNPAHPFAVESSYGGPDGLRELVRAAHAKGIAVIVDVVYNHFGPSDLDLWQFDGWSENSKGGIYFYNDDRSATPWGDTRPDYGRGEVRDYIRDNALMWFEEFHVDGLRYDMTPYIRSTYGGSDNSIPDGWDMMRWINEQIRSRFDRAILIAEDLREDVRLTTRDGAAFHAQWDPGFVHPVRETAAAAWDSDRSVHELADAVEHSYGDAFARVIYTESHDEVANGKSRVPTEVDSGDSVSWFAQKRSTVAASFAFTSPGIPMIFQGQEFLQGGYFRDDVQLDWHQNDQYQGIVRLYRDLIRLRRNVDGDTAGLTGSGLNVFHVDDAKKVIAFHRWRSGGPGDDVVVVANLSANSLPDHSIGMPYGGQWRLKVNSDAQAYSTSFGGYAAQDLWAGGDSVDGMPANMAVDIGPYTVLVYARA